MPPRWVGLNKDAMFEYEIFLLKYRLAMKSLLSTFRVLGLSSLLSLVAVPANGQSTWTGAATPDENWSTAANWTGGAPGTSSAVTFPDGTFPVTTNVQGLVNNIVQSSTSIASLIYNNGVGNFVTTLIPSGNTVTVSGNLTVGPGNVATVATVTGAGTLISGANGNTTLSAQSTSGTAVLDLSGLANFVFNPGGAGGPITLGTSAGGRSQVNLAAGSNYIVSTTFTIGNNNTSGSSTVNLGNGTNIINADTITMGFSKTQGTMQFLNNAGGGLSIANHTGTGRATLNLSGESNTGSTTAQNNGFMFFNGGTVNILASTLTLGNRVGRAGSSANGVLNFDHGTVDVTTVNMALNTSPTTSGSDPANATISVGGPGVLKIGTGGLSLVNQAGTPGAGTLIVTNGGTVICSNNIYKTTSIGVGTLTISGSTVIMAGTTGTIGVSNGIPVDNLNITNSTLTLPVGTAAGVSAVNFNPDATTQNSINVSSMPSITAYPAQFPVISYSVPNGNLNSFVLSSLPTGFSGYISNNAGSFSIDLVVTNGPAAKADQWGGGINNLWDTTTLNWTNVGAAVAYLDLDFVTFDDQAHTNIVNLTGARFPATLTVNNSVLNYTFNGVGKISGPVALVKTGTASLTLAESGGDNFSGGITANGGTIILDNTGSAISGGLTIAGGSTVQIGNNDANGALPSGTLDDEGTLVFNRTDNVSVGAVIPGAGALTQNGIGRLALSAVNTYFGNTTVNAGTLALTNSGSIATSPEVDVTSAGLDVSGVSASATLNTLDLTNSTLTVKVGYLQTNLNLTALNMGGTANTINVRTLPPIANYPATVTLLQSAAPIVGYNFVLGSLPAATPSYAGASSQSGDQMSVLLTLTAGPIGTRPSVTWSGVDALNNINTNWSDAQNWRTPGAPAAAESVFFNNTATAFFSPFSTVGDGIHGIVNPDQINNIVDASFTNASLNYANGSGTFHNTQVSSGKTLTINGSFTVSGAGGNVTILGSGGTMKIANPSNNSIFNVFNGTGPTLDLSGLDSFVATVNQVGIGYNIGSGGTAGGVCYLARTNSITTGVGSFGNGAAIVVGTSTTASGLLFLGQTNALFVDGIVVGTGQAHNDLIAFNPTLTSPAAYIRGVTGNSSRVTAWYLGDASINLNNSVAAYGQTNDFSGGTLDAMVATLNVGQGSHGNTVNPNTPTSGTGTFTMGAGKLDVTTLNIGVGGSGGGGSALGTMNVTGGTVIANNLALALPGGGQAGTSGTLNLTNANLVVTNGITVGAGTAGGTITISGSTVKILNNGIGSFVAPLTMLNLDAGTLQLNADASSFTPVIIATTINTGAVSTINIAAISNFTSTVQIPLISYTGNDPYGALTLGTVPPGYSVALVDNTGSSTVDLSIAPPGPQGPRITSITVSGTTLSIQGTNGSLGGQYVLLGSTNVLLPFSQWTPLLTNSYAPDGTFNLTTNIVNPAAPKEFYLLRQ
jgi:autotransporter-associated beta strand protein